MDLDKIGKFIALNRKNKGLTQEQLAEKLGVTNIFNYRNYYIYNWFIKRVEKV